MLDPAKISAALMNCLKDECPPDCPAKTEEWKQRGHTACHMFWDGEAAIPRQLVSEAAAAILAIKSMDDREATQVMSAYWIPENIRKRSYTWICSECRARAYDIPHGLKKDQPKRCSLNYCPNCGMPMTASSHLLANTQTATPPIPPARTCLCRRHDGGGNMKYIPILFSTKMVIAIIEGRKTMTRRIAKKGFESKPPCKAGDVLWVRETWKQATTGTAGPGLIDLFLYKADEPQDTTGMMVEGRWHPAIHMPKKAARLFLRVVGVRAERLQDMDEDDVCDEGADRIISACEHMDYGVIPPEPCFNVNPCNDCIINRSYPELFGKMIWNKTIKPADLHRFGWAANPWVWVIMFERIQKPEGWNNEKP